MTVKRTKAGRWKVTVDVGGRGADRERRTRVVDSEEEARTLERSLRRRSTDAHRRTVLDAVDRHLELFPADAPQTEIAYRSTRDNWIAPTWLGAVELDRLDVEDLERFYGECFAGKHSVRFPGRPASRRSVVKVHRLLSLALKSAKRVHWISTTEAIADAVVPRGGPSRLTAADEYDLADVARSLDHGDVELADLVQTAIATGARVGELAGLRWRDVELVAGEVAFHGNVSKNRPGLLPRHIRKMPKTGKPRRMTIDEACRAMLQRRYARQVDAARVAGLDDLDLDRCAVFSTDLEQDFTLPDALAARWRRATAKANGRKRDAARPADADPLLRFHDLRHVNASEMQHGNVPVSAATERTGHASNATYLDVYGHHRAHADDLATSVLAETWRTVTEKRTGAVDS
jgi:integrase